MDRYTQIPFDFPEKGNANGLMKTSYNSICNSGTQSSGRICHIKDSIELNFGTIRKKNDHFNLLRLCDGQANLPTRIYSENRISYAYSFLN